MHSDSIFKNTSIILGNSCAAPEKQIRKLVATKARL